MLLFIIFIRAFRFQEVKFQYISCYCLSTSSAYRIIFFTISIHLMLLFISLSGCGFGSGIFISIHLMLLFIIFFFRGHGKVCIFQYISCYCLSSCNPRIIRFCSISIHLMLLFIDNVAMSLSTPSNFNTSHVTVYPRGQCIYG